MINWVLNNPVTSVCILLTFRLLRLFYVKRVLQLRLLHPSNVLFERYSAPYKDD